MVINTGWGYVVGKGPSGGEEYSPEQNKLYIEYLTSLQNDLMKEYAAGT